MFLTTKTCPKMSDKEVRGLTNYLQRDVVSDQVTSFVRTDSGLLYSDEKIISVSSPQRLGHNLRNNLANNNAVASV